MCRHRVVHSGLSQTVKNKQKIKKITKKKKNKSKEAQEKLGKNGVRNEREKEKCAKQIFVTV